MIRSVSAYNVAVASSANHSVADDLDLGSIALWEAL